MKNCDCPLPILKRTENIYLGRTVEIRLCCLARSLGFYESVETDPQASWEWDHGTPPEWLEKRLKEKGLL